MPYNHLSMTEAKPTPKPRSAFLPVLLIVVGLVIVAGVVVAFVPLVECDVCVGLGNVTHGGVLSPPDQAPVYPWHNVRSGVQPIAVAYGLRRVSPSVYEAGEPSRERSAGGVRERPQRFIQTGRAGPRCREYL